jgi:hypothetical protein
VLFSPVYVASHPRLLHFPPIRPPASFPERLDIRTCRRSDAVSVVPLSPILLPNHHCQLTCPDPAGVTTHYRFKSFSCNTYGSPCKYCKQKTYCGAKPFRCNTYKKRGVGVFFPFRNSSLTTCHFARSLFSGTYKMQIAQLLSFDIHTNWWGGTPTGLHPVANPLPLVPQ